MKGQIIGGLQVSKGAKDITGERYGKLVAIRPVRRKSHGDIVWLCHCDCGKEKETTIDVLRLGCKSCGCAIPRRERHPHWSGYEQITGIVWCSVREGAKKRHIPFNITQKQAWDLYIAQDKKCAITGLPIDFGKPRTASLDRIDSQKSYTIDNIWWVHAKVNRIKWKLSMEEFKRFCALVQSPLRGQTGGLAIPEKRIAIWTGTGNIPNWLIGRFKDIAKRRECEYDDRLDSAHLWNLFLGQNGTCALTGLPIAFPPALLQAKRRNGIIGPYR